MPLRFYTALKVHSVWTLSSASVAGSNQITERSNVINFYASAQRTVAGGIMVLSCSSVRACVCASRNIVNTICRRIFDTFSPNLQQRCIMGQRWTRHNLGSKAQRSRSRWNKAGWKRHFWAWWHDILTSISRVFTKRTPMMYYRTEMNALNFGVKTSKFKVTVE